MRVPEVMNLKLTQPSIASLQNFRYSKATINAKVVKLLLEHSGGNINFNARDDSGWIVFMMACSGGDKNVVKLFLDHSEANIDFNARNDLGLTAFMFVWICTNWI